MSFFEQLSYTANNNLSTHFSYHICRCRLRSCRFQASVVQKRIFLRISRKRNDCNGSMTLEAALLLPLYLFFMISLFSIMNMIRFQADMQMLLSQTARQISVYAPAANLGESESDNAIGGVAATVLADVYLSNQIDSFMSGEKREAAGVTNGISYWQSSILLEDDVIDLVATYEMEPMCNLFLIPEYTLVNRAQTRAWTGYEVTASDGSGTDERIVYITESGSVFHLSRSCTHLDLSISAVDADNLDAACNASGESYRACEYCGGLEADTYFITQEGDCYHTSLSCSGLKRSIIEIPISEAGDRPACSRCGNGNE